MTDEDRKPRVLLARYAQVVAQGRVPIALPEPGVDPAIEASVLATARRVDTLELRGRAIRAGVWSAVAALASFMLAAGYFGW